MLVGRAMPALCVKLRPLKNASERNRRQHGSGCPEGQAKQQVGEHERPPAPAKKQDVCEREAVQFWPLTCYLDRSKEAFSKLGSACMTPIMRVIRGTTEFLPVDRGVQPVHGTSVTSRRSGDAMSLLGRRGRGM